MDSEVDLTKIFQLQDVALSENLKTSCLLPAIVGPISRSVRLTYDILRGVQFEEQKQTVIRHFAVDAISHIVIAIRLGLWGALPESLSVLRGGIESCAQLAFVVTSKKYRIVILEMEKKFKQVDFDSACLGLGAAGRDIKRQHGRISEIAAHSTSARFGLMDYEFEGNDYDRLGFAFSSKNAENAVFHCMWPCMIVNNSLRAAYEQDGVPFTWKDQVDEVERAFDMARQGSAKVDAS